MGRVGGGRDGEGRGGVGRRGAGGEGRGGERRGGELKCYRQTYRTSDEAGPRGAFAPKKVYI